MRKRLLVFHPAIAPYRVDFFNSLSKAFEATFYFEFRDALEQSFDPHILGKRLSFTPHYLKPSFAGIKNLRFDVWEKLKAIKPEIVFISEYNLLGMIVLLYKWLVCPALRIVITCDDNLKMARSAGRIKRLTRSLLLRHVFAVILVNEEVKDWYEKNLPYKAQYIHFPILQSDRLFKERLDEASPLTQSLRQTYALGNKRIFLYVGRLAHVKNVPLLLRFFGEIHKMDPDTALLIVGDGELRDSLQAQVKELGLERSIHLVGKKEGKELMAYYHVGDIFVLPSMYEPFGTVVNEALLAGCYVLCSSEAGASCLIADERNGFRFDVTQPEEMIRKGQILLKKVIDHDDKRNKMLFSYQEMIDPILRIIKE